MKETVFRFKMTFASDQEGVLQRLTDKLRSLKGVQSIESESSDSGFEPLVRVCFEDPESAKKLHRKLVNKITSHDGLTVSRVATTLTDIF